MAGPGWSIADRTCVVTGATSGIGEAAALELARRGARVVLVARDSDRARATQERIEAVGPRPLVLLGDLARLSDVRRIAGEFLARGEPLHVLINNAGLVTTRRRETPDGHEYQLAVNHLAPFLLTNLVLGRLRDSAPARVVTVSSMAHRFGGRRLDVENLQSEHRYRAMQVYARTKLMNILFTRELARRLAGTGVTANCLHPGNVATRFGQNNPGILDWGSRLVRRLRRTPEQGADTIVHLAASPDVDGVSGGYFVDRRLRRPGRAARRDEDGRRLWAESVRLTGLPRDRS